MLRQIFDRGFATVRLSGAEAPLLTGLYKESAAFFALDAEEKLRYGVPNRNTGYRPHGYAHAGYPDKPDLNDSFLYWRNRREPVPNQEEIAPFLEAFEAWRMVAARIVSDLINSLREYYHYEPQLPFEDASVLQVNSFGARTDEELLQQPHEDAVLITVISTSAPGLEEVIGDISKPLVFAPDEVLVMPGSILTEMTGNEIRPFFHLARNHGVLNRKSIMYFVSPDTASAIVPFVVNDFNRSLDIRDRVLNKPQTFGLAEDFVSV